MTLIKCKECGKEISDAATCCPGCGMPINYSLGEEVQKVDNSVSSISIEDKPVQATESKPNNSKPEKLKLFIILGAVAVVAVILIIVLVNYLNNKKEEEAYNSLPVKIDYSMTSYYGNIDTILETLGLDFDLVTMGANCYTGVQKNEFTTTKYGVLHTEFRYCKSNNSQIFRVYNDEAD